MVNLRNYIAIQKRSGGKRRDEKERKRPLGFATWQTSENEVEGPVSNYNVE